MQLYIFFFVSSLSEISVLTMGLYKTRLISKSVFYLVQDSFIKLVR